MAECLRSIHDSENCRGKVTRRHTDLGTPIDECVFHMEQSRRRKEEIDRRYPDSPVAPPWFDPTYAGESWDGD